VYILSPSGQSFLHACTLKGFGTNNKVEYEALVLCLEILISKKALNIEIYGDSQLVINQVRWQFQCKSPSLMVYSHKVEHMLQYFRRVRCDHIPREDNEMANKLAQLASGYDTNVSAWFKTPSVEWSTRDFMVQEEMHEVCKIDILNQSIDWRMDIVKILKDPNVKRINPKLRKQACGYFWNKGRLYKKDPQGILLTCIGTQLALTVMTEVH